MYLPITVIKDIFELNQYDVQIICNFMSLNQYYYEQCKKNIIWKAVYIYYYSREAYEIEKNSRVNGKMYQRSRKEHMKFPPLDPELKNWYTTVSSIFIFNQLKNVLLDIGNFTIKFIDHRGDRKLFVNPQNYSYTSNHTEVFSTKIFVDLAAPLKHPFLETAPLVLAVNPIIFLDKKELLVKARKLRPIHFKNAGLLALQSFGLTSGIVVMCGMKYTQLVAISKGVQLDVKLLRYTGMILRSYVSKAPEVDFWKFHTKPTQWFREQEILENYELRKLHDPTLNSKGSYFGEMYFNPEIVTEIKETRDITIGLPENTFDFINTIKKTNPKQSDLFNNIVLTGGISMIDGFQKRFKSEMLTFNPNLLIYTSDNPIYDVLKGLYVDNALTESLHDIYQVDKNSK